MHSRTASAAVAVMVLGVAPAAAPLVQSPTLDRLLADAAAYVATYEAHVSAIALHEEYVQTVTRTQPPMGLTRRELRSEVLLLNAVPSGWIAFRDVVEVDGKPVRNRDDRLRQLFASAAPDAMEQEVIRGQARYTNPTRFTVTVDDNVH